jgi:hypothetical protein
MIFTRWAEQNPKDLSMSQSDAAALALREAFPCK